MLFTSLVRGLCPDHNKSVLHFNFICQKIQGEIRLKKIRLFIINILGAKASSGTFRKMN